jgi:hypothetical protein
MAATVDELLRMSITGEAPPSSAAAFEEAKATGNASFGSGDYEGALAHYAAAEAADPSSAVPHTNSSLVLLRLNRPFDAARTASTALALLAAHPDRPGSLALSIKSLLRRATARTLLGEFALAEYDLREILVLEPGHEQATAKLRELRVGGHIYSGNGVEGRRAGSSVSAPRIVEVASGPRGYQESRGTSVRANDHPERLHAAAAVEPLTHNLRPDVTATLQAISAREADVKPGGTAEFERAWRTLAGRPLLRAKYILRTVGSDLLRAGILGQSLTAALVREICDSLVAAVQDDSSLAADCLNLLLALSSVARFEIAIMFLSAEEKASAQALFDLVELRGETACDRMRNLYGV